jgi:ApbE superfamily uncharacterized protein (UPF0280 family)
MTPPVADDAALADALELGAAAGVEHVGGHAVFVVHNAVGDRVGAEDITTILVLVKQRARGAVGQQDELVRVVPRLVHRLARAGDDLYLA